MASLLLILFVSVRAALVLIAMASVSVTVLIAAGHTQTPLDPFADYADIMPGQPQENIQRRGFTCLYANPIFHSRCVLNLDTGVFSSIEVNTIVETGLVSRAIFRARENTLTFGDLALLWGRPQINIYGQITNLRWPNTHVVSSIWPEQGQVSYWQPMVYIVFTAAE